MDVYPEVNLDKTRPDFYIPASLVLVAWVVEAESRVILAQ